MSNAAAKQYAQALMEALEHETPSPSFEAAAEQLGEFASTVRESAELRVALLSPALPLAGKERVLARLGGIMGLSRTVQRFLAVVVKRRRLGLLGEIRQAYQTLLDERASVSPAEVVSAMPLDTGERERLQAVLERLAGRRVRCDFRVDTSLLGGVSAKLGAQVFDGSILGRMQALERRLASRA